MISLLKIYLIIPSKYFVQNFVFSSYKRLLSHIKISLLFQIEIQVPIWNKSRFNQRLILWIDSKTSL